ncbi:MAG: MATE family efflux transporter [Candidatus Hydrogenedentes bacterium]|nr:MATE family efflux transporter [Candidatus Hydrogenedentota bacterium]
MTSLAHQPDESRWTGVREIMVMSGPIILGSLSFAIMEFIDRVMVNKLGTEALAAIGSASIWSYTMSTLVLGVVGCVGTFVAQRLGRNENRLCGAYAWQGLYLSLIAGLTAVAFYPIAPYLFGLMGHEPEVTRLELVYFQIRLFSYLPLAFVTALATFFQAANHSVVPMFVAIVVTALNIVLNYMFIFGHWGAPAMGIAGAAWATNISMYVQFFLLFAIFLSPFAHARFNTRANFRFDREKTMEILRVGVPAGGMMFLDVANWSIFISLVVGRLGVVPLAANNVALSFMQLCFIPAFALNQGIAAIVGQYIGRQDYGRAKARTYTALRLGMGYMVVMGIIFAIFGSTMIEKVFAPEEPLVLSLGHQLLVLAAVFQLFDAICIVMGGALRGAGDTRWMLVITFLTAYVVFIPLATTFAFYFDGGVLGAWIGAAIYIIVLSGFMWWRFRSERWRDIRIFSGAGTDSALP